MTRYKSSVKCSVNNCTNEMQGHMLCAKHLYRYKRHGDPNKTAIRVRGTGSVRKDGYVQLKIKGKLILEHVYLAECALGRKLRGEEQVHHMDGNRSNNKPTNLVVCPNRAYHTLLHTRMKGKA